MCLPEEVRPSLTLFEVAVFAGVDTLNVDEKRNWVFRALLWIRPSLTLRATIFAAFESASWSASLRNCNIKTCASGYDVQPKAQRRGQVGSVPRRRRLQRPAEILVPKCLLSKAH